LLRQILVVRGAFDMLVDDEKEIKLIDARFCPDRTGFDEDIW